MSNILITGASGMIGLYLTEHLLNKKHCVYAVDARKNDIIGTNPNYHFTQCDINDKDVITSIMNSNKIDVLVHLANSVDNDIDPYVTDVEMKKSKICDKYLYSAASDAGVKSIVILSTTQVYGLQKGREPIRETTSEKAGTNYADMKLTSEKYLMKALKKSSTVGVVARAAPIYDAEYTQNLRDRVFDSRENVAYIFKDGEYGYSFCCIYNLIDFINGIINIPDGKYDGIYNIADTNAITAKEIIDYEKAHHRIGAVIQKNGTMAISINKGKMKTDYRYFDPSTTFNNWYIDNTKARRIAPLRWSFKNTK